VKNQLLNISDLDKAFRPNVIAVVGASDRSGSLGQSVYRNLVDGQFPGEIVPVNWKRSSVGGQRAYHSLEQLPAVPDLVVVCTPAETVPDLVNTAGTIGAGVVVVLSAGFREAGPDGAKLEQRLHELRLRYPKFRIIGPNCLGIISPHNHLNASFATGMPEGGGVAVLSQSGALGTALLDWAQEEGWGVSHFVSVGNMVDVSFADYLDYFATDVRVTSAVMYLEGLSDARSFLSAARAFTRTKPIVAFKSGRFEQSARAASSHTGAMVGSDAAFDAAFDRAGIVRVDQLDGLFDVAEVLAKGKLPEGPRVAVVTNAGGPGIIAADALIAGGGQLTELSASTLEALDRQLPRYWSKCNPIDVLGDATSSRYQSALEVVIEDQNVDAVLVLLTPQAMTSATETAEAVAGLASKSCKPIAAVWMGGHNVRTGTAVLNQHGIPTFNAPEHGVRALMALNMYRKKRELLYETPRQIVSPSTSTHIRTTFESTMCARIPETGQSVLLSELESKELLEAFRIPTIPTRKATTATAAVEVARSLGFPVALKILSPEVTHKSDMGGVQLNLWTPSEVEQAFTRVSENIHRVLPECRIDGVTVQPMIQIDEGMELILGAKRDSTFGMTLLVGAGGITAECLKDVAIGLPPLNERLAIRMLESLRIWPLLKGYRGRPAVDIDQLLRVMISFSYLLAETPEIAEFDVNPLWVSTGSVLALDARAVLQSSPPESLRRPYGHLAIRPYPNQFQKRLQLSTGQPLLFRPIRPEDEPQWRKMLKNCTLESIRHRFRGLIEPELHANSSRYCMLDYDRELAIVAELDDVERTWLLGVGRLVANANHDQAEFALLIADPWQNQGLGSQLTEFCMEVATAWGVQEIVAEAEWGNERMLHILRRSGFTEVSHKDGIVRLNKTLPVADPSSATEASMTRLPPQP